MMDIKQFRFYDLDLRMESYKDLYMNAYGEACEINEYGEVEVVDDNVIIDEFTGFLLDGKQLFTSDVIKTTIEASSGDIVEVFGIVYMEPEINSFAVEFWITEEENTEYLDLMSYMAMLGEQSEIHGICYDELTDEEIEDIRRIKGDGKEEEW